MKERARLTLGLGMFFIGLAQSLAAMKSVGLGLALLRPMALLALAGALLVVLGLVTIGAYGAWRKLRPA